MPGVPSPTEICCFTWTTIPRSRTPFCISRAVSWLQAHPEVAAVGFAQLNPDGSLQKEQIVEPTRSYYVHTFWSYGCLIRKGVQRQVGGFNELFGYYYEEEELSLKFRAAGYQVAFVPSLQIIHYRDPSNRTWSKLFTLLTRNAIISSIQHFPVWLLCPFVLRTLLNYSNADRQGEKIGAKAFIFRARPSDS